MRLPWLIRDPLLARRAAAAQAGDAAAMRDLYRQLYPELARFVGRRIRARADAEELVARVFLVLVERLADFDPQRGSLRAWLFRIARNAIIDHVRASKPLAEPSALDGLRADDADPLAHLLERERLSQLSQRLDELEPELRELLALRYGDGLRHREIAELLDLNEAAVKQRISRAIRALRRQLDAPATKGAIDVPA
ncbi:MAG: sigma-70 family RNA polymerase sigma factor [Nannocystis sp.]|jgi:RNA polymerase sigma-70 factor (ECF subfamily)|nr:sigma-70 family RNA polymerase sigma factor [Nannocystis sp.]